MDSFGIGLSGLDAAQKAFEIIGNNIANAATDGYHRQRINLSPAFSSQVGTVLLGGGVDVASISRIIDGLLQKEMFNRFLTYNFFSGCVKNRKINGNIIQNQTII